MSRLVYYGVSLVAGALIFTALFRFLAVPLGPAAFWALIFLLVASAFEQIFLKYFLD